MKRMSSAFAAALLIAAILLSCTACGNGSARANDPIAEPAAETKTVENAGSGKKVYFAGPMFNQAEKDFNLALTEVLEEYGYEVFLPQRDGIEAALLEGKSEEEMTGMIFKLDADEVRKADIIFMNLDGRVPDEGACVELGIAYGCGKRCYGFKTDTRTIELGMDLNPMIAGCMTRIFKNYDGNKLIDDIKQYLSENDL